MKLKKKCLKQIVAGVLSLVMVLSLLTGYELKKTVKASDSFPTSGVHTGTLSHGGYHMEVIIDFQDFMHLLMQRYAKQTP